jgi:hypothetical protein
MVAPLLWHACLWCHARGVIPEEAREKTLMLPFKVHFGLDQVVLAWAQYSLYTV